MKFKTNKSTEFPEIISEVLEIATEPKESTKPSAKTKNLYIDRIKSTIDFLSTSIELLKSDIEKICDCADESDD